MGDEVNRLLAVRGLSKHFGALKAVNGVSFEVHEGQIFAVIGPNGAGKTTAFNVITGVYRATSGDVTFRGQKILGLPQHRIAELGITRTFQKLRLFKGLSVLDNVMVAASCRTKGGVLDSLLSTPRARQEERWSKRLALELLEFVGIVRYQSYIASNLAYGDQRRLEIARALAAGPKLLLLDEPTAGMNPAEKGEMMALIQTIRDKGVTVLLVEHDMKVVMGISDRIVVLDHGEKICEGSPEEVQHHETVIEAYLGRGYRHEPVAD